MYISFIAVTTAQTTVGSSVVIDADMTNVSRKIQPLILRYLQERNYSTYHRLVGDGDSQRLRTTLVKYYDPAAVDVEDYDLLVILTNDSISAYDKRSRVQDFIIKTETVIERRDFDPINVWSVDLLSPKDPNETTSLRLPVRKFIVVFRFFKDFSEELQICQQLSRAV